MCCLDDEAVEALGTGSVTSGMCTVMEIECLHRSACL